jgi:hypothetical protein
VAGIEPACRAPRSPRIGQSSAAEDQFRCSGESDDNEAHAQLAASVALGPGGTRYPAQMSARGTLPLRLPQDPGFLTCDPDRIAASFHDHLADPAPIQPMRLLPREGHHLIDDAAWQARLEPP